VGLNSMFSTLILIAMLAAGQVTPQVRQFQRASKSIVPKSVLDSKMICGDTASTLETVDECEKKFESYGGAWTGDVNDDGVKELVVFPGWTGTGGSTYFLLQRRGADWIPLIDEWFTSNPEFDILPITRNGYHDLRIAIDQCVKWNGKQYVDYEDADYHRLSPEFFDASNWWNAFIVWDIHYQGLNDFHFEPQWFPMPAPQHRSSSNVVVNDPQNGLKWVAFFKGGVWGVKGESEFLLLPQPAYAGAQEMEIDGDWLVIHGDTPSPNPSVVARYNLRTKEMIIIRQKQ